MKERNEEDQLILKWYYYGYHDELNRKTRSEPDVEIHKKAYSLGVCHAIIGDDMPSIDYLLDDEVIDMIKKQNDTKDQKLVWRS